MNYYKQGDAANADKIKAAFEEIVPNNGYDFKYSDVLFFTYDCDGGKYMMSAKIGTGLDNIILTHPDYKELELSVEPKFKVGDEIIWDEPKGSKPAEPVKIIQLIDKDQLYMVDMSNGVGYVHYDMQDYYKLAPKPHYDIANFHAGMPVLVRIDNSHKWSYTLFSHYNEGWNSPFSVASCCSIKQCIPFNKETEHLLGTTDMPSEEYINW